MTNSRDNAAALADFISTLHSPTPPGVFNPWSACDATTDMAANAASSRLQRLCLHLAVSARFLLIGEASGYQGCKVSGIPFTSERLILEGQIPRIPVPPQRLSSRPRPWSEPSATTMWKTLHGLGIAPQTVLWNAYPWHPHKPGAPHSNRTPTRTERQGGVPVLEALLGLFPTAHVFAVGRNAQHSLAELGIAGTVLRHPSMGGASAFAQQLRRAVEGMRRTDT